MPPPPTESRPRLAALPQPLGSPADPDAARLSALRLLSESPHLSQRELARALGLSLGKTHYVLHALLEKGLVKARNFRRSGHKLPYAYVLTPRGLSEKLQLTRSFLARKETEYEALRSTIDSLRSELDRVTNGSKADSS